MLSFKFHQDMNLKHDYISVLESKSTVMHLSFFLVMLLTASVHSYTVYIKGCMHGFALIKAFP